VIGLILSHPTLGVTVACALYLSAVVVWPRSSSVPAQTKPSQSPLSVDNVVVQDCMLGIGFQIRSGSAYKAVLVDFFNDPRTRHPAPLQSLSAKVTFYDQEGNAYASLVNAHWRTTGKGPEILAPGSSACLVLALTDCTDAAFTAEERYGEMGLWQASRVGLKSGPGTALVRVSHIVDGQVHTQEFRFSLLLEANPEIRQLGSDVPASPATLGR
jgi:hypothetical protein